MRRVLVIEDNENLALGLRANLEIDGYVVDVAGTGEEGLRMAESQPPDIVILDLMLPGIDGLQVLRRFRRWDQDTPVLILTARGEESDKVQGLRLGADDYVTKPFGLMELLARVDALLRRASRAVPGMRVHHVGDLEIDLAAREVRRQGSPVALAPKEFDLLAALLRRKGEAVSRNELMDQVWGYASGVISRTVDTHVAELRRKLEANPGTPSTIVTVRKVGYRLQDPSTTS